MEEKRHHSYEEYTIVTCEIIHSEECNAVLRNDPKQRNDPEQRNDPKQRNDPEQSINM